MFTFKKADAKIEIKTETRNALRDVNAADLQRIGGGATSAQSSWINSTFNGGGATSAQSAWVRNVFKLD